MAGRPRCLPDRLACPAGRVIVASVAERLTEFAEQDAVSDLLRAIRVRTTVYCRSVMRAPWGFAVRARGAAAFHLVSDGACWLDVEGESTARRLHAGDLVLLPTGRGHAMRDHASSPVTDLDDILAAHPVGPSGVLRHGGGGAATTLVCGGFELEGGGAHPGLEALPAVVHVRGTGGRPARWVASMMELMREASRPGPGAEAVVSRLGDALVAQALREALTQQVRSGGAPAAALRDPQIARAVAVVNREPERAWTVGDLAAEAGLSRSAFAARFRGVVGESPMRYVTRCRIARAAALLETTDAGLAAIARRTGYETEFSFGRAFKRVLGVAPGAFRERARAVDRRALEVVRTD
jgi:AraC family transcriptional regulator, alkane utilization regulator